MTTNQRFYTSWTLMMTAAIVVISANSIFVPATSYIARDLGVAEAVMSSNMVFSRTGMIVCMFCFAAFADLFTSRRLAQAGLVICTVSCVLSAIATNIYVFDLAQIIEAVSRATIMLTMQLWIAGISNRDNLANRLSWYTVMITVAPILAPSVGGVIADLVSWQYCFIVLGVLSLAMLAGISVFRIQEKTEQQEQPNNRPKFSPKETLREYRQVISHSPCRMPVILPRAFTMAMLSSEEDHATLLSFVAAGSTVAFRLAVPPAFTVSSVLSSRISSAFWVTWMLMFARTLLPSSAMAEIRVLPRARPVTVPLASTVAAFSLEEIQVTRRIVASSGRNSGVRVIVSPAATLFRDAVTEIRFTGWITTARYCTFASGSCALAIVSRVLPGFSPVT